MNLVSHLIVLIFCFIPLQDQWKNIYSESAWEDRDRWQKASELISYGLLKPDSRVADIGCSEGYLSVKLSTAVSQGVVYAVDLSSMKLEILRANLEKRSMTNVVTIKGAIDNPRLTTDSLDAVFILDTYHEIEQHDKVLEHIKTSLRKGGRLILCEPIASEMRSKTRKDQAEKHEIGINYALQDLKKAGFTIILKEDPFVDRVKEKGDKMWLIVAEK